MSPVLVRVFSHSDRTEINTGRFITELNTKGVNLIILECLFLDSCSAPLLSMPNSPPDTSIVGNLSTCGPYLRLTISFGAWGCFSVSLHQSCLISFTLFILGINQWVHCFSSSCFILTEKENSHFQNSFVPRGAGRECVCFVICKINWFYVHRCKSQRIKSLIIFHRIAVLLFLSVSFILLVAGLYGSRTRFPFH